MAAGRWKRGPGAGDGRRHRLPHLRRFSIPDDKIGNVCRNMAVTIKDVARESGVNVSTVSRALNNGYGVQKATRDHVVAVAARLRYSPNRFARSLVTGRSHSLALVVSDIRNPFFAEVARGAEDAAYAAGSDLVLCNSDLDPDKQMRYVQSLL